MSLHLHLRAVAESEIRDDHTWLAAFMSDAWDNHADEYAAGIADSIDKVWNLVNDLYAAAEVLPADAGRPWTLPVSDRSSSIITGTCACSTGVRPQQATPWSRRCGPETWSRAGHSHALTTATGTNGCDRHG